MYQAEVDVRTEQLDQLPARVIAAFNELRSKIDSRTVLPWGEHCTECVWPKCYTSCDLYSPRSDGGCRRFVDGMVRLPCPDSINGYVLKVRFKQWGKLWTPGNTCLFSINKAREREDFDHRFGVILHQLPLPEPVTRVVVQKRYGFKKRVALGASPPGSPTSLIIECYNPAERTVPLSLTLRSSLSGQTIPFQKLIPISPGFRRVSVPIAEIEQVIDLASPFSLELLPAGEFTETTLYFGLMDFVKEMDSPTRSSAPVKCIVWDLDNTLWDGVLVERGASRLHLKPAMADILKTLDQRGILQSIASKNDHAPAMEALAGFQLNHLFLHPQISWRPKSLAVHSIAKELNIGLDSILFIDDSEFELEEVRSACPGVRCLHACEYDALLDMKGCQLPITEESGVRRELYQVEQNRKTLAATFQDDYKAFLVHCEIKLSIDSLKEANLDRVHELAQRTNQMNFSGTRYRRDVLQRMLVDSHVDTYVLSCEDRFGKYGVVGFAVIDRREPRLTDLMFSCRVQAKRVEHAFLSFILTKYLDALDKDFYANYRKTSRNAASGQVFNDFGFLESSVEDGVTSLMFPRAKTIPNDGIISVDAPEEALTRGQSI